jgi:high affinity Mn2+ porin
MNRQLAISSILLRLAFCGGLIVFYSGWTCALSAQSPTANPAVANSLATPEGSNDNCGNVDPSKAKSDGEQSDRTKDENKEETFNVFGQSTVISQWHGTFHSPYGGPHSFLSENELATSETGTLSMALRTWEGGAVCFDPEIAGGIGLSNVFGIGAFPNGDITRVGNPQPTPYIARLYFAQTIGFGGEQEKVESGPNVLAGSRDVSRLTISLGKFAAEDFFDNNTYSHDPRVQFMNWALMYDPAWDYPADVRGYTFGGVVELNQESWAFRYGIFGEPLVANGPTIDPSFAKAHGQAWELEERYRLFDHPGKARFLVYWNRADMGNYNEATFDSAFGLNIANTRRFSSKYGYGLNLEQEFNKDLGGFLRWGWNDGHTETWAFTECDRTINFGLTLKGTKWCRPEDFLGYGVAIDGLSAPHRNYLAAGGLGFELGDRRLNYAPEVAFETYYIFKFKKKQIWITPDLQLIGDPGYNRDRGPVVIGGLRLHAEI